MSSWKTVEGKVNRRPKNKPRTVDSDDAFDDCKDHSSGNYGTLAGNIVNSTKSNKNNGRRNNSHSISGAIKAEIRHEEEEEEKLRREREMRKKKIDATAKQRVAQEHARKRADPSQWPHMAEALGSVAGDLIHYFDDLLVDDPIVSVGGIGALLAYAPGVFERYVGQRVRTPGGVITGERLLSVAVCEDDEAAAGVCTFYKNLIKSVMANEGDDVVVSSLEALLTAVYGNKGAKELIPYHSGPTSPSSPMPSSGLGAVLAVELTISQFAPCFLANIERMLAVFYTPVDANPSEPANTGRRDGKNGNGHLQQQNVTSRFNSSVARRNFINIVHVAFAARHAFETEGDAKAAQAKAVANIFISGALPCLFSDISSLPEDNTNAALNTIDISGIELIHIFVHSLQYVSQSQGGTSPQKAYTSIVPAVAWKRGVVQVPRMITAPLMSRRAQGNPWVALCLELLTRDHNSSNILKACVPALLQQLEDEIACEGASSGSFAPASSPAVVLLSACITCGQYGVSHAIPVWRSAANKTPMASKVLLAYMEMYYKAVVGSSIPAEQIKTAIVEGMAAHEVGGKKALPKLIYDKSAATEAISLVSGINNTDTGKSNIKGSGGGVYSFLRKRVGDSGTTKDKSPQKTSTDSGNDESSDGSSMPIILTKIVIFIGLLGAAAGVLVAHGDIKLFRK